MLIEVQKHFEDKIILFTPLNWGLGHAARCVPLIRLALSVGKKVIIGSDGDALEFLKAFFPEAIITKLPSYGVRYPFKSMLLNAIVAAPKALNAKWSERRVVNKLVSDHKVDLIVSDNRYGCYSNRCKSVFISHQLNILHPNLLVKGIVNFQNKLWVRKFDQIWVPDYADRRLSGELSYASSFHPSIHFIGPQTIHQLLTCKKKYDVCVLLSGPEPQRSILEGLLLDEFAQQEELKVVFIAGKMTSNSVVQRGVDYKSHVLGRELTEILNASRLLISRSGYSTIMDIDPLELPAIFIPTPGQTEQEYLGRRQGVSTKHNSLSQDKIKGNLLQLISLSLNKQNEL